MQTYTLPPFGTRLPKNPSDYAVLSSVEIYPVFFYRASDRTLGLNMPPDQVEKLRKDLRLDDRHLWRTGRRIYLPPTPQLCDSAVTQVTSLVKAIESVGLERTKEDNRQTQALPHLLTYEPAQLTIPKTGSIPLFGVSFNKEHVQRIFDVALRAWNPPGTDEDDD